MHLLGISLELLFAIRNHHVGVELDTVDVVYQVGNIDSLDWVDHMKLVSVLLSSVSSVSPIDSVITTVKHMDLRCSAEPLAQTQR